MGPVGLSGYILGTVGPLGPRCQYILIFRPVYMGKPQGELFSGSKSRSVIHYGAFPTTTSGFLPLFCTLRTPLPVCSRTNTQCHSLTHGNIGGLACLFFCSTAAQRHADKEAPKERVAPVPPRLTTPFSIAANSEDLPDWRHYTGRVTRSQMDHRAAADIRHYQPRW